tara:strand:- start:4430 stop:4825 length:396 start_codon:yes stop_codon:yes gene_type:complete
MKVKEVMMKMGEFPLVEKKTILKEALMEMGKANLGLVCIVDEEKRLLGLMTDGDLRRKLLKYQKPISSFFVDDTLNHSKVNPITCNPADELKKAVKLMGDKQIWDLPVIDDEKRLVGLLHLHPAIKKLIEK